MCLCVILFRWTLCWTFFRFSSQWIQISVVIFNTWFNSSPNNWNGEKRVFQTLEKQNRSNLCTSHNIFLFIWDEHSLSPTILLLYRCALTITNLRWYPFLKKKMNKFANKTFFFLYRRAVGLQAKYIRCDVVCYMFVVFFKYVY